MNLAVWTHRHRVGTLSCDGASSRFAFSYDPEWMASAGAFPLAPSLPLASPDDRTPDQHSSIVRQFFQNLLPEEQALEDCSSTSSTNALTAMYRTSTMHATAHRSSASWRG